jgi:hypothetical protein
LSIDVPDAGERFIRNSRRNTGWTADEGARAEV